MATTESKSLMTIAYGVSFSTAATMMSRAVRTKITKSKVEGMIRDKRIDKPIKLETLIQYIEQVRNLPVEIYIKETSPLMVELIIEFEGDKEAYLPWVRFLDIAYVHKMIKITPEEQEVIKKGIDDILVKHLLKDNKAKSLDWRVTRKILSLNGQFSLGDMDLKQVEEDVLKALKAEIQIALDHLLWQKESLFVELARVNLISLQKWLDTPADQEEDQIELLNAIRCGRFDKDKFQLKNTIIIGEDGGLYVLLNRMNQQQQDALVAEQVVTRDYLKDKIKEKEDGKGEKIVLGKGGFGTVRFALSLLRTRSLPAEIVCVKKTLSFQQLSGDYKATPLEQITTSTLGDYFTNDRAQAIYSPSILDLALVTTKNVIKDMKDHRKGYLMMEILPQNTATRIFADKRYQKWEYQKPYLLDVLENTQKLLESDIAMTDLKPDNTLYDTDTRKATIIDLGGSVKVANTIELSAFDLTKYSFQVTRNFRAPELAGSEGIIDMYKAVAFSCGKVIEAVTHHSDYDKQEISKIVNKLIVPEPQERISIPEAITEIKAMGDDSYRKNIIFSHYINKVKDRLENKKSAISINEDIDKTRELLITLNSTSSDPSKYKDLKTEDLFKKIDDFLTSENTKQVMAIFGVAGSGKSIVLQLKFIEAVMAWQPGKPVPIYFNLANGLDLDHIIRTLNAELDTNLSLDCLDGQHLYIDSFDEGLGIEDKRGTLIKEYFRQLGSPKILITCRTDYLQESAHGWRDWFSPESKELEVCYVAPINYNGHQDLSNMVEKYVSYAKQHNDSVKHTTQEYLNRLAELQLTDLINTGFMFFLVLEVLFQLQDKKDRRINKADIYANYISHYQNNQISKLKNQDQQKRLAEMVLFTQQPDLCSSATELGKYLACQMHLLGQARLGETDKLFVALDYDSSLLFKHQTIIHMLKLLPLKIVTTHSGKRLILNQEVKIGFIHETIKNYYLLEAIKSEVEKEGKSLILASKSIIHDSELVKLIVLAMQDSPKLTAAFLKAIENSKHDKSSTSIINASNSISLLVAANHSFSGCDLSNISIKGANIVNGIFHNTNLDGADLSGVDMSNVNLNGASLNGTNMRGVNFSIFPDLIGHTKEVNSVAYSPDGKFLASGSEDTTIKIWNPTTAECLQTLTGHTNGVNSVVFSPDGKLLASGSMDKTVKIWNSSTGECLRTLTDHTGDVRSVSFSFDGKFLASGSQDKTIKIWYPSTGKCLRTLEEDNDGVNISFSPDGIFLASGSNDSALKIWDPLTGKCLQTLTGHSNAFGRMDFSLDGKSLVGGAYDNSVKIVNVSTGECLQTLNGHKLAAGVASFSPDGKFVASGSRDETIKIWNSSTGECLQTLNGHTGFVNSVVFSPDGKFLASASNDNTIKIWDPSAGESLRTRYGHIDEVKSISFSGDGKFLASASRDKMVYIWNPSTGDHLQTLKGHEDGISSVGFSPDGKFVASGSWDGVIKIWNPTTGACLHNLTEHTLMISSVGFSPDSKVLASTSWDKKMKIWDPNTGKCLKTIDASDQGGVNGISFSPDSKFLASESHIKGINIWDLSAGKCIQTLHGHTDTVISSDFSPDGKLLVTGSMDETIKIWNLSTSECLQTLDGDAGDVHSVSFSPDGKFIASGSWDHTIKIWDASTGECLQTLKVHIDEVTSVIFSSDGKFLASGSNDKTIKVFEFDAKNLCLLKNIITATPSPLVAEGATLNNTKISQNNRLVLTQKGADATSSIIDNTSDHLEHHRDTSPESIRAAKQLSDTFFLKSPQVQLYDQMHPNPHQSHSKVPANPDPRIYPQNSAPRVNSGCCQIFAVSKIIYDDPLLNCPALFVKVNQIFGSIQTLKLSNMQASASIASINDSL